MNAGKDGLSALSFSPVKKFQKNIDNENKIRYIKEVWDTKFIRGSMQIFLDHPSAG